MIVTEKTIEQIDSSTVDLVREKISSNEVVRLGLPDWGWIYLEPRLPFLFLYTPPENERSWESELFVLTEAACIAADQDAPRIEELISVIAKGSIEHTDDAFLLLEIRNGQLIDADKSERPNPKPGFVVHFDGDDDRARPIAESFASAAESFRLLEETPDVELRDSLPEESRICSSPQILHIVVVVTPVHVNPETAQPFPIVLEHFRRGLSHLLRRVAYEFERELTHCDPVSHRALGRHEVLSTDWAVDGKLTEIADSFSFLLDVTPVNQHSAWREFVRSGYSEKPVFHYKRLTIDPEIVKGKLYRIPIDEVEDPVLCHLFREKRAELSRMLTMLEERETSRFIYSSLQLYGEIEDELLELAMSMIETIPPPSGESSPAERTHAEEFAEMARSEIRSYLDQMPDGITTKVEILPEVTSLIVSNGVLCVPESLSLPHNRVRALLNHEVGTHVVTWLNGKSQKLEQLYTGLAGYDELQEGLAVLAEYFADQLTDARLRLLAGRVVAARRLTEHGDFVRTCEELVSGGFSRKQAFGICVRVWRGGGMTKDAIYLRGLRNLLRWLSKGGDIRLLYLGKITEAHIPLMLELIEREILHAPLITPRYLDEPETVKKLDDLKRGLTVLDLRSA